MTLDDLAQALRGMPRDARMVVRLHDGRLADIDHVKPAHLSAGPDPVARASADGSVYGIVLVPRG